MSKVWTIGYEQAAMPDFLAALKAAQVEVVADIRAIAASRRPGFSKNALAANLAEAGIEYRQFRALGTPPDGRAAARAHDLPKLRKVYSGQLELPEAIAAVAELSDLVHHHRTALLCYERQPEFCHRSLLRKTVLADCEQVDLFA